MPQCESHSVCINDAITKAEMICKDRGLRLTELRRRVLKLIWSDHVPIKAYDILDMLSKNQALVKPPTVYRSLDFLLTIGLIHRLSSINAYVGCSHPLRHNDCYFLICSNCGQIKEFCNNAITDVISANAKEYNFETETITLEIKGGCRECKSKLN